MPEFDFQMTTEAAEKNFLVLSKYGLDLAKAIEAQQSSPIGYGSEFRPPNILKLVFGKHPNWNRVSSILENGSDWPLEALNSQERASDLQDALEFGNHKGATGKPELLEKLITKDVTHGYGLPLPLNKIDRVP